MSGGNPPHFIVKDVGNVENKTLLHICCAPCALMCIETLREEGIEPVGYWFNPNIHPYTEYKSRRGALREYAAEKGVELIERDEYGLREFVRATVADIDGRCGYCYAVRLYAAAEEAARRGLSSFTTSLLISPYQKHELIRQTAERAAEEHGVDFLYRDFRPYFREGQARAREHGLYMQKYCGCIFSEEERYLKKKPRKVQK